MTDQTAIYDAIDAFQRTHRLPGLQHAQIRGLLAEHLARVLPAAPAAAPSAPADRAALRDRIRRAVCEAEGFAWDSDMLEPDEYGDHADAVLAVLPAPADQAAGPAALREAAAFYEGVLQQSLDPDSDPRYCTAVRDVVMGLRHRADEAQQAPTDEDVVEAHRLALSFALDLGTGAPWDAIHDRTAELRRVADEAQQPETQAPVCMCGHPMHQHHEDVCLTECGCNDGQQLDDATDLPGRLAAALTARFTELGNPFAAMRYHEQGPDGWPASHSVGPNKVADVLRELLAHDEPAAVSQPGKEA